MAARATLAALAAASAAYAQRTVVDISAGWRFGPVAIDANVGCATPISLDGLYCSSMWSAPNGTASPQACAAAACAEGQPAWNFCSGGAGNACGATAQCLVGGIQSCSPKGGWQGAARDFSQGPAANSAWAQSGYDDSGMAVVDIPHDAVVAVSNYSQDADAGQGYLPVGAYLYRKHFTIPAAWQGSAVTLLVDGALSTSSWWLNGKQIVAGKQNGYLPLVIRLDTAAPLNFGKDNVLAVFIDGTPTSGWWYEGAGLTRNARLVVTNPTAYAAPFGVASPHYLLGNYHANGATPAEGLFADMAVVTPSLDVFATAPGTPVSVAWSLIAPDGVTVLASNSSSGKAGGGNSSTIKGATLWVPNPQLWSVPRPYLYTLAATVSVQGSVTDAVNETIGLRSIQWDANEGMLLNQQPVKIRGFCQHESFTGLGAALVPRIDLVRLQQMRGSGGNGWRTSHNPAEPFLYDVADRLGVVILDETRVLATVQTCADCQHVPGEYAGDQVQDIALLAVRDRNHASVHSYSLCNEAGCGNGSLLEGDLVVNMKAAIYGVDESRAVSANMGWLSPTTPGTPMSTVLDVMGMSHNGLSSFMTFHALEPEKPLVANECCSCETMRGEQDDFPRGPGVYYSDYNQPCLTAQVSVADNTPYVAGQYIWTLHDYMGEPDGWPHVSSSFGSFDLAGVPKSSVWWYRSRWLGNISTADAGRPPVANTSTFVRIVEAWQPPQKGTTRVIHVYSNAPSVKLLVNGAAASQLLPIAPNAFFAMANVTFAPGTLTAQAIAADGTTVLATHAISSWGAPASIALQVDAPSPLTGTGNAVYLDGQDVALVRATILDAQGNVVGDSTLNVTFSVTGAGRIAGVGNGDPQCKEPSAGPWRSTYHGIARAIVRAGVDATGTDAERALRASVNTDAGKSSTSSSILAPGATAPTSMTLSASAPGLPTATITINLSADPADSVLAVAAASVGAADIGE